MPMRDSRYIYKAEDIRRCFPQVSDTTISKWLQKGFVDNAVSQKAIRQSYKYSALQVVHVGVLAQLSAWGVLAYYRDAVFHCPVMGDFSLTEPTKAIESYYALGPNLSLTAHLQEIAIEQFDKRQRQTKTIPHLNFMHKDDYQKWHDEFVKPLTFLERWAIVQGPESVACSDKRCGYSYSFLDISSMIVDVYGELNISHLLK